MPGFAAACRGGPAADAANLKRGKGLRSSRPPPPAARFIANPDVAKRQLDQSFTGVVLVFEKGPNFKKGGEKQTLRKALAKRLPGSRMALAYAALGPLALAASCPT